MRTLTLTILLLLGAAGCARHGPRTSSPQDASTPARRTDLLLRDEIDAQQWANLYELVQQRRSNWLHLRGKETILGEEGQVRVVFDGMDVGDATVLKGYPAVNVEYLQFFDGAAATARWGMGYGKGAIYVSTRER